MEHIEIANSYRAYAHCASEILAGSIGLTEKQDLRLKELQERKDGTGKPLTANMETELADLIKKRDNPELPQGAKTHCKKWLKNFLYGRREQLKNKYVRKGNECEEEGFTLMAVQLNLGMVYKNKVRKVNDFASGECDLDLLDAVYDNKCSWSLDTFPMFEEEPVDDKYEDQLQVYGVLYNKKRLVLCYTLVNATKEMVEDAVKWENNANRRYEIVERMVFTQKEFEEYQEALFPLSTHTSFVEIPEEKRIKKFEFTADAEFAGKLEQRVTMCKEYILSLLNNN